MKKSQLKPIIKAIIKEAAMANTFRVILFGDKEQRELAARSFVRTGKGQLQTQVSFPSNDSTAYTVWDGEVLKTIETILQGLGWKRVGVKGKDIVWTSPDWQGRLKEMTDKPKIQKWEWPCEVCGEKAATHTTSFGQKLCDTCSSSSKKQSSSKLPPETPVDNYSVFTKMLQGSGYDIPSKEDVADEISRFPASTRNATWKQLAKRWLDMYSDFAQYGTD